MANAWRVGCGGSRAPRGRGAQLDLALRPHAGGGTGPGNVRLGVEAVRRDLLAVCPPGLLDLLEVAVYVYAADQAADRGRPLDLGMRWRRSFAFRVPVRDPDRWADPAVTGPLVEVLSFLSEDEFRFEFVRRPPDPSPRYLTFAGGPFERPVDRVVPFSGGLDSTAGAVAEAVAGRGHVLLVHHRSSPKLQPRTDRLAAGLMDRARAAGGLVTFVPVTANKGEELSREFTQRTRSFLYLALAAAVGAMAGHAGGVRFYENGVVGLNLPISAAVVGARATRTAHPRTLGGFARLLAAVAGRPAGVDNPFRWDTRADVIRGLAAAGCGDLVALTTSCGATRGMTAARPHCGVCSQCVDRRLAVLAAGAGPHDPADGYRVGVLTGDRTDGDRRLVLAAYLDTAARVEKATSPAALVALFGEAARVLRATELSPADAAAAMFGMYRRHAAEVGRVLDEAAKDHVTALRHRELPEGCTLRLVYDTGPPEDPPRPTPAPVHDQPVTPPAPARAKPPAPKRGSRTAKIERLVAELTRHLRAARDHAVDRRDRTGEPELLPRPTQKQLAARTNLSETDVSRCLADPSARELRIAWAAAADLSQVMGWSGPSAQGGIPDP